MLVLFKPFIIPALPIGICLALMGIGFLLVMRSRRWGRALFLSGFILALLFGNRPLVNALMGRFENVYPPFLVHAEKAERLSAIHYIVVLGASVDADEAVPLSVQLGPITLARLIEAISLHHQLPHTKLILSGGSESGISDAEYMKMMALQLGVEERDVILETTSKSTYHEVAFVKEVCGTAPIVVVTSAVHMPRAMALFHKAGLYPIAAPVGHLAREIREPLFYVVPTVDSFYRTGILFSEFFATLKEAIKGRV